MFYSCCCQVGRACFLIESFREGKFLFEEFDSKAFNLNLSGDLLLRDNLQSVTVTASMLGYRPVGSRQNASGGGSASRLFETILIELSFYFKVERIHPVD